MGSKNQKVLNFGHQDLSVYGIGTDTSKATWKIIGDRLLEIEALVMGEYNVLSLTGFAMKILKSEQTVDIRTSNLQTQSKTPKKIIEQAYTVDEEIFDALRVLRSKIAKEEGMPAYIIFDNKTLTEMAHFLPDSEASLLQINGVGNIKIEKYGARFLALLDTLRTADFQPPVQEPAVEIAPVKKLHITYQTTLELIEGDLSIESICEQRELTLSTILGHINKLANAGQIEHTKRQQLFATIPFDKAVRDWIIQGIEQLGSVDEVQYQLSIFKQLNQM